MRQRTILFVDDEEKTCKYFKRLFRRDFNVIVSNNGQEGLETFERRRDEIGIVVTDQMMPRMTGLELLEEIRRGAPEIVNILSTAYSDSGVLAEAEKLGLIDYAIEKPWDLSRVAKVIMEASSCFQPNDGGDGGTRGNPAGKMVQADPPKHLPRPLR